MIENINIKTTSTINIFFISVFLLLFNSSAYAEEKAFPIIPCTLCGSQDNMQRQKIKQMLTDWDKENPGRTETIFSSIQNIVPSHLLDTNAYEFSHFNKSEKESTATIEDWLIGGKQD